MTKLLSQRHLYMNFVSVEREPMKEPLDIIKGIF